MDKLQLYITISNGQYRHLPDMDINPDDDTRDCLCVLADAIADIKYDPKTKHIFYLLKSTDKGVFVVVLRTIPDRQDAHLAAWIFVPYDIDIPDADLSRALDDVVSVVSRPSINSEGLALLRNTLDRSFPQIASPGAVVANQGNYYAHRFYGANTGDELSDLIGNKRYQTAYLRYAGILLIDKAKVNDVTGNDLTDEPLDQMVRIFPPADLTPNYRPLIFGKPFDCPFLAPLMGTVEVIWECPSAPDVSQSVMINRPDMHIEPIAASRTKPAEPAPESADDTVITSQAPTPNPQKPSPNPEQRVINTDRQLVYNFEIPAKSASISSMIRFTLTSHSPLNDCPIDGYELSDDIQEGPSKSNHLVYVSADNLQSHAIWAVCGFVVGILLTLICTCATGHAHSNSDETAAVTATDTTKVATDTTKVGIAAPPADTSLAGAIKYLDTNQKWTKAELETYPDLHGLYHDLNTINRERIINHWGKKLESSRQFAKIVEHTKKGKRKKPYFNNPKPGQMTFNTGNDETILVRSYLNCIDH